MTGAELKQIFVHQPFRPFRVKLASGEYVEINRRFRANVWEHMAVFGVNEDPATGFPRKMKLVNVNDIVAVEMTEPAA